MFIDPCILLETHDGLGTTVVRITIISPIIHRHQGWSLYRSQCILQGHLFKDIASIYGCFHDESMFLTSTNSDARAILGFLAEKDENQLVAQQETLQNYRDQFSAWKAAVDSRQDISILMTKIDDKSNEQEKTNLMIQFYADVRMPVHLLKHDIHLIILE